MKSCIKSYLFAAACISTSAFISAPAAFKTKTHLNAYTDGDIGVPTGSKGIVDKSLMSNIVQTNLPPSSMPNGGKITMVGSGPGDPDLLTMAAHKILTDPDVLVISDRLVSQEILDLIKGECKIARKLPGCAEEAQEEVCFHLCTILLKGFMI